MIKKTQIDEFLAEKKFALAGVSSDKKKFGYKVFADLRKNGYDIIPINPTADEIDGVKCYPSAKELPEDVKSIHVLTPKEKSKQVVEDAVEKGIKNIWIQQMSDTPEALKIAKESDSNLIYGKCIYMFAAPIKGPHRIHRAILGLFGRLPK